MNPVFLIAAREYRQVTRTRGFWMLLLIVPLAIAAAVVAMRFSAPPKGAAYVIVDPTRGVSAAIDQAVMLDTPTRFVSIPPPPGVPINAGPDQFGRALQPFLRGKVETPSGKRPLSLAVWVPKDFGPGDTQVRMWTNGAPNGELGAMVRSALASDLRASALSAAGLSPSAIERIDTLTPRLWMTQPPEGAGHDRLILRSAVPLALVYLLLLSAMTTGSMMLQGVIEERSNKLFEAVLACVTPDELMRGKLLGLGGVGMTVVAAWAACAVVAALASRGEAADLARRALQSLDQPWMALALIFYFFGGYLIVSSVFLAIGAISDSMQDAQAYLMPMLMLIMIPVILMIDTAVINPDATAARVMTWIPLYTPFAMLTRLGGGVSLGETLGSGAVMIAFIWLELLVLGRIFRASLLSTGQRPPLAALVRLVTRPQAP